MVPELTSEDRLKLLRWARNTITRAVRGADLPAISEAELTPALCAPHAAFVTLKKHGELRGCIGEMEFNRPLWENVVDAAVAAALKDPRFTPVLPEELPEIHLEISVLEPPVDLPRVDEFDAQRHGIIVERGWHRALLLPKVAQEYGWTAERVLACVCEKAGLPADAWREPGTRLQVFTAVDFAEASKP